MDSHLTRTIKWPHPINKLAHFQEWQNHRHPVFHLLCQNQIAIWHQLSSKPTYHTQFLVIRFPLGLRPICDSQHQFPTILQLMDITQPKIIYLDHKWMVSKCNKPQWCQMDRFLTNNQVGTYLSLSDDSFLFIVQCRVTVRTNSLVSYNFFYRINESMYLVVCHLTCLTYYVSNLLRAFLDLKNEELGILYQLWQYWCDWFYHYFFEHFFLQYQKNWHMTTKLDNMLWKMLGNDQTWIMHQWSL